MKVSVLWNKKTCICIQELYSALLIWLQTFHPGASSISDFPLRDSGNKLQYNDLIYHQILNSISASSHHTNLHVLCSIKLISSWCSHHKNSLTNCIWRVVIIYHKTCICIVTPPFTNSYKLAQTCLIFKTNCARQN